MSDTFEKMDRMYRLQRYFYDLTRKYYLLGRDRLLGEMGIRSGERVLEIGCGTGRNLIILARRFPDSHFYGLDASAAMLETARAKIDKVSIKNITLATALADNFSYEKTFGLAAPFDKIFFSYSISMIPPWRESIDNALRNLKPGGGLFIVDFYDQNRWPAMFRILFQAWLRRFSVHYPGGLPAYLNDLHDRRLGKVKFSPLFRTYSFLARFEKAS